MASSSRLKQLRRHLQPHIDALPDRPLPQQAPLQPESDSDETGGVSLELYQSLLDAPSTQATLQSTNSYPSFVEKHTSLEENSESQLVNDAETWYTPNPDTVQTPRELPKPAAPLPKSNIQRGDLASTCHHFTPIQALARYPYQFCDKSHMQDIASAFFDQGKFWEREWDLYYVWNTEPSTAKPIILVRENQVEDLLEQINLHLQIHLRITNKQREDRLVTSFPDHPRCLPRYLGRSHSRAEYEKLLEETPSDMFRAARESSHRPLEGGTLEEFKQMMEELEDIQKAKSKAAKLKKQQERLVKQKTMADQFKRAQRYLGLRQSASTGAARFDQLKAIDPLRPVPFVFEQSVVFVCVDVESFERDHRKITEVGLATLDTRDLVGVEPGTDGANWRNMIRARHFLINEHRHLKNGQFVEGHPDKFSFGQSTSVALNDVASQVAECFRAPFGAHYTNVTAGTIPFLSNADSGEARNIIFLGHDTSGDIRYLRQLGYDPMNTENIVEALDTAVMYRVWRRESQAANLRKILNSFDIAGWYLHNAGNDAVFTVHAMLAICVREATIRGSDELRNIRDQDKATRLQSSIEEARQRAREEAEGWSDNELEGDGGVPVPLTSSDALRSVPAQTPNSIQQHDKSIDSNARGGGRERGKSRGASSFQYTTTDQYNHDRRNRISDGHRGGTTTGGNRNSGRGSSGGRSKPDRRARGSNTGHGGGRRRGQSSSDSSRGNPGSNPQVSPTSVS